MRKTKELSQRMRRLIVDEHSRGIGYRKISSKYNIHVSTIGAIIQRWKRYGVVINLPRKGRPRKLDESAERLITRKVMRKSFITRAELQRDSQAANAHASQDTIGRALHGVGIYSRSPQKTPLLKTPLLKTRHYVIARRKFASEHLQKPAHFWDKTFWSDETKLELFGGNSSRHRPWADHGKIVWKTHSQEKQLRCPNLQNEIFRLRLTF